MAGHDHGTTARTDGAVRSLPIPTYSDLRGKVAVVTGGSRGIGAAVCRLLAWSGAKVVVNGRDKEAIGTVVGGIQSTGGQAIGIDADCTDFAAIEEMRQRADREFGVTDVLVACAGGSGDPIPTEQMPEARWRFVLDNNLTATFLIVKSFLPGMIERRRGSIITMASSAGRLAGGPSGGASAAYHAAKAGVVMLSRRVANEVAKHGIRVNCLAPAAILTDRLSRMPEPVRQQVAAIHPLQRIGLPEDVALAALFLASEASSWITGVTLDVAGGLVML